MRRRPVTFRYLAHGDSAPLARNKGGEVETVMYQFLAPMLLNEVQKRHRRIEEQQAGLEDERAENAALRARVEQLENAVRSLRPEKQP